MQKFAEILGEKMSNKSVQIENEVPEGVISAVTLGGFSVSFNGNEISFGQQNESQIVHLLQLLIHFRDKGVTRDLAKAELFRYREVDDVSHSIRNIIYNLRKKLREYDLPESQFVVKRSGIYYWADDIPVVEDAALFEESFNEAMAEESEDRKLELLVETIYMYKGRFLAGTDAGAWGIMDSYYDEEEEEDVVFYKPITSTVSIPAGDAFQLDCGAGKMAKIFAPYEL